eukprot:PhF_6_TR5501/c0_g1_i1/m.7776
MVKMDVDGDGDVQPPTTTAETTNTPASTTSAPATKTPMKVPMKVPMKIPMKVPMKAPMTAPPAKMVASPPKPVVATTTQPPVAKKAPPPSSSSSSSSGDDDDSSSNDSSSDDDSSSSQSSSSSDESIPKAKKSAPPKPKRAAATRTSTRKQAPSYSPSSTPIKRIRDDEPPSSGEEDEKLNFLELAKRKNHFSNNNLDLSQIEDDKPKADNIIPKRPKRVPYPGNLETKLLAIRTQLQSAKADRMIKEEQKTTSLGTSKTNYIDPRVISAWCKRANVDIKKVFSATLQKKFPWAMDVDPSYRF